MRFQFCFNGKFCFNLLITFLLSTVLHAQKSDSVLYVYATEYQPERIYIQFDKPAYSPGETVWLKAYLLSGIMPANGSKNLYIDFANEEGKILAHTIFPIIEGSARGQFEIPADFTSSSLHIKAYTNWMLNFDTAFLYRKAFRIFQKKNTTVKNIKTTSASSALIEFFPEGGYCLEGLKNKIAFKANDAFGKPVKVKGRIINSKKAVVDSFQSVHDGMSFFYLIPEKNETYTAIWIDEQQQKHQTVLPAALSEGAGLEITPTNKKINFVVKRTETTSNNLKALHLVATMHQQMVYMANIKLQETPFIGGSMPIEQLPTGIIQFTLFDAAWKPLAERIAFINNHDAVFYPEVGFTTLGLSKRKKNVVEINLNDSMPANFSLAITDAAIGTDNDNNIISHLLLASELRGKIYNPAYYFSNNSDSVAQHLDLVMLTHGWRRFKWNEIVQGKFPAITYPKDTAYLTFSGKIFGATPSQIRDGGELFAILKMKDSSQQMLTVPIKPDGTFQDSGIILFDTLKIYYQFLKNKQLSQTAEVRFMGDAFPKPVRMEVEKNAWMLADTTGNYYNYFLAMQQQQLSALLKGTTLEGVTVTAKTKSNLEKLNETYTSGLFRSEDAYQFDLVNDFTAVGAQNIFTYLQGKVPGLQINVNGMNPTMQWRGSTPSIYLNEMPVDASMVSSLSISDIAYVKVFRPPFMGGFGGGAGGAIAIYTRKGNDASVSNADDRGKGLPYKIVAGYTALKEFYSPNYDTYDERNEQPDMRSTLYWAPMIFMDAENHKMKITFYNNDVTSSFRLILEGMAQDGRLAHVEKVIE